MSSQTHADGSAAASVLAEPLLGDAARPASPVTTPPSQECPRAEGEEGGAGSGDGGLPPADTVVPSGQPLIVNDSAISIATTTAPKAEEEDTQQHPMTIGAKNSGIIGAPTGAQIKKRMRVRVTAVEGRNLPDCDLKRPDARVIASVAPAGVSAAAACVWGLAEKKEGGDKEEDRDGGSEFEATALSTPYAYDTYEPFWGTSEVLTAESESDTIVFELFMRPPAASVTEALKARGILPKTANPLTAKELATAASKAADALERLRERQSHHFDDEEESAYADGDSRTPPALPIVGDGDGDDYRSRNNYSSRESRHRNGGLGRQSSQHHPRASSCYASQRASTASPYGCGGLLPSTAGGAASVRASACAGAAFATRGLARDSANAARGDPSFDPDAFPAGGTVVTGLGRPANTTKTPASTSETTRASHTTRRGQEAPPAVTLPSLDADAAEPLLLGDASVAEANATHAVVPVAPSAAPTAAAANNNDEGNDDDWDLIVTCPDYFLGRTAVPIACAMRPVDWLTSPAAARGPSAGKLTAITGAGDTVRSGSVNSADATTSHNSVSTAAVACGTNASAASPPFIVYDNWHRLTDCRRGGPEIRIQIEVLPEVEEEEGPSTIDADAEGTLLAAGGPSAIAPNAKIPATRDASAPTAYVNTSPPITLPNGWYYIRTCHNTFVTLAPQRAMQTVVVGEWSRIYIAAANADTIQSAIAAAGGSLAAAAVAVVGEAHPHSSFATASSGRAAGETSQHNSLARFVAKTAVGRKIVSVGSSASADTVGETGSIDGALYSADGAPFTPTSSNGGAKHHQGSFGCPIVANLHARIAASAADYTGGAVRQRNGIFYTLRSSADLGLLDAANDKVRQAKAALKRAKKAKKAAAKGPLATVAAAFSFNKNKEKKSGSSATVNAKKSGNQHSSAGSPTSAASGSPNETQNAFRPTNDAGRLRRGREDGSSGDDSDDEEDSYHSGGRRRRNYAVLRRAGQRSNASPDSVQYAVSLAASSAQPQQPHPKGAGSAAATAYAAATAATSGGAPQSSSDAAARAMGGAGLFEILPHPRHEGRWLIHSPLTGANLVSEPGGWGAGFTTIVGRASDWAAFDLLRAPPNSSAVSSSHLFLPSSSSAAAVSELAASSAKKGPHALPPPIAEGTYLIESSQRTYICGHAKKKRITHRAGADDLRAKVTIRRETRAGLPPSPSTEEDGGAEEGDANGTTAAVEAPVFSLRTAAGTYVCFEHGRCEASQCDPTRVGPWEKFEVAPHPTLPDRYTFYSCSFRTYLSVRGDANSKIRCADAIGPEGREAFALIRVDGPLEA